MFSDFRERNFGLLLVACSQAFFASMNVFVKLLNGLGDPVPVWELIFVRMAITYFCSEIYMHITQVEDPWLGPSGVRRLLILRGACGCVGLGGLYYSLQYLSLSDAIVLTFMVPICTGISGSIFLGEHFTFKEAIAGLCSLFGVVLIARPPVLFGHGSDLLPVHQSQRLVAVCVALVGVLGSTGAYTTIRAIGNRASPLHMMVSFSLLCIVISPLAMMATKTDIVIPNQILWLGLLLLIGIFGFIGQFLLTMGLQREKAGRATLAVYTEIIYAVLLDRIIFQSTPPLLSILGTAIILSSALYVAISKQAEPVNPISLQSSTVEEGLLSSAENEG